MTYKDTMSNRKLIFPNTVPIELLYKIIGK